MTPKALISILLYRSEKFLPELLASLEQISYPHERLEIYFLDNAAGDKSGELVQAFIPRFEKAGIKATLEINKVNEGFAGGHNHAFRTALAEKIDYVYLLNSDAIVEPSFLTEAVAMAESNKNTAIVQSLILLHPDTTKINTIGNALHYLGFGYALGEREPITALPRYEHFLEHSGYASGAGVLFRTEMLKTIGIFDDYMFLYHEDLDMSYRARLAGFDIRLAPHSIMYHRYEFSRSITKFYYMERNRFYVLLSVYRLWTIFLILPALLFVEAGLFIFSITSGWWREKLRAYGHMLKPKTWLNILERRSEIKKLRRTSDREMTKFFTSVIESPELKNPTLLPILNKALSIYWQIIRRLII